MTYGIKHVVGITTVQTREGFFGTVQPLFGGGWRDVRLGFRGWTLEHVWVFTLGAHIGHLLEFLVALACYYAFFADGSWKAECAEPRAGWVARVVGFNLACEVVFVGFWHWLTYMSHFARGIAHVKFNPKNQYAPGSPHLRREMIYTTLGWLQSAGWQCLFMYLWASGRVPFYADFWATPLYSVGLLAAVTYWREIHFYWVHRGIHPWFDLRKGLLDGDVGAFLYRWAHKLHHKSTNPGPWSGLSMHPVEHFLYYSCAWLPALLLTVHPLHFLYAKFHADIAPIGGHDGYDAPGPNGDFHWLHHHRFECNYGVPFPIDFDRMFGTWVDYKEFKAAGGKIPKHVRDSIAARRGKQPKAEAAAEEEEDGDKVE